MRRLLYALAASLLWTSILNAQQARRITEHVSWYLPRDSAELYVTERGRGDVPVVVLHGGPGGDFTHVLDLSNGLTGEFRFVFYDQRGSLRSRAAESTITMDKHVADLEALRSALGADKIKLVSHSAGTLLAFEYLHRYPARVSNLVLVGALPHKNGPSYFDEEYGRMWQGLQDTLKAFEGRPAVLAEIAQVESDSSLSPAKRAALIALVKQWNQLYHIERWRGREPIRVSGLAGRLTRQSTNFDYNYGPALSAHKAPVTVINGELDYVVGPRDSPLWKRLVAQEARNVRLVVVPRAGHMVWVDQPALFESALRAALR